MMMTTRRMSRRTSNREEGAYSTRPLIHRATNERHLESIGLAAQRTREGGEEKKEEEDEAEAKTRRWTRRRRPDEERQGWG